MSVFVDYVALDFLGESSKMTHTVNEYSDVV